MKRRWYIVCDADTSHDPDDLEARIWTVSLTPYRTGWETDSGCERYGLTKDLAEELADAANAAWEAKHEA